MKALSEHNQPIEFVPHLIDFYRKLKGSGVKVTLQQEIDAYRSLGHIDLLDYTDFYHALRANLIAHQKEVPPFDSVFSSHWIRPGDDEEKYPFPCGEDPLNQASDGNNPLPDSTENEKEVTAETNSPDVRVDDEAPQDSVQQNPGQDAEDEDAESEEMPLYSPEDELKEKDFSTFMAEDLEEIKKAISYIAEKIRIRLSRRKKRNPLDQFFDFRRTIRKNIRHGGDIYRLAWKTRKKEKNRIVMLCDVSGSMEMYSRFLIQFLYGLQKSLYNMETFVFSTRLSRVTALLKNREYEKALARISKSVHDWSGGTRIGDCLHTFNRKYAPTALYGKTVVIIISDGWDCGEEERLRKEMARLKKYAHHIIWLNPLLSNPQYEPACMGMRTSLPFLDQFLPLYNLNSLAKLGQALARIS
jgi:uncharacterized protein